LQAVGPQAYGLHEDVAGAGHDPAPLQLAAAVAVPAEQLALRHWAVGYAQAATLRPSQEPPHDEPSVAHAGRAPWGTPATGVH
jgi:hypothetical protein